MTRIAHTLHRSALLAAALTCLAATPAVAATTPPDRADGLNGAHPISHTSTVGVPDRIDGIGSATPVVTASVVVPDRADGLGSARLPTAPSTATIIRVAGSSGGFDWLDAAIGAAAALGLTALGLAAGLGIRSRRQSPLSA
jgi:hypothetical protein